MRRQLDIVQDHKRIARTDLVVVLHRNPPDLAVRLGSHHSPFGYLENARCNCRER
jgi:broad-specificity NMP kinase